MKKKVPQLTLQEGFLEMYNQKAIEGKKRGTLLEYLHVSDLTKRYFVPDPILMDLTDKDWNGFFGWLRKDYKGGGFRGVAPRPEKPLSEKSIKNVHIVLCALYSWALKRGHVREHIIRTIDIPSPFPKPIEPYTREEIEALLKATEYSKPYKNNPKRKHRRQTHLRDRLLILLYLDTGCRESELANAKVKHLSLSLHRLHVYGKGRGNMGKERDVFFGKQVYDDFWKYLNSFNPPLQEDDPIFPTMKGGLREHLTPDEIYKLIKRLAEQAEIPGATVHRLRHTFAISFLRNNGKPEVLVGALGHADLKMTMRYLKIAETDRRKEADKTSPVDHWKLR